MQKNIALLGSTGSIGTQTLDLVARHPDRFRVIGLVAGNNIEVLKSQISTYQPLIVSVGSRELAQTLESTLREIFPKLEILFGEEGAVRVATHSGVDFVVSAIVGAAGLKPTLAAIEAGKPVALANKESLVIAGELMTRKAREKNISLLPIDSEHSAIFQALAGNDLKKVRRLILTASGGPFYDRPADTFSTITVDEALKHPNWKMGPKITIDSATLMNKGLEVIEASWFFNTPADKVDVHIHPQSIIHSMVEYIDGSVMAQLGVPDMRCAISYAMAYPERIESGVDSLDLLKIKTLTFFEPDLKKFPCLRLAYQAAKIGKTMPAVLNAANEKAVALFLNREISFTQIPEFVEKVMQKHEPKNIQSLEDVQTADLWARTQN